MFQEQGIIGKIKNLRLFNDFIQRSEGFCFYGPKYEEILIEKVKMTYNTSFIYVKASKNSRKM